MKVGKDDPPLESLTFTNEESLVAYLKGNLFSQAQALPELISKNFRYPKKYMYPTPKPTNKESYTPKKIEKMSRRTIGQYFALNYIGKQHSYLETSGLLLHSITISQNTIDQSPIAGSNKNIA